MFDNSAERDFSRNYPEPELTHYPIDKLTREQVQKEAKEEEAHMKAEKYAKEIRAYKAEKAQSFKKYSWKYRNTT